MCGSYIKLCRWSLKVIRYCLWGYYENTQSTVDRVAFNRLYSIGLHDVAREAPPQQHKHQQQQQHQHKFISRT